MAPQKVLGGKELGHEPRRVGTLDRDLGHGVRDVGEVGAGQDAGRHVLKVLSAVGGVDNHQVGLLTKLVNHQVIHAAAVLVAKHGVAHATQGHVGEVVGQKVVQGGKGGGAAHRKLAHVRDVKQTAGLAHGHVLGDDVA